MFLFDVVVGDGVVCFVGVFVWFWVCLVFGFFLIVKFSIRNAKLIKDCEM